MKTWSTWLVDLLPNLPDCPIPLVEHSMIRVAQDFMTTSRINKVILPFIPVVAGIAEISVPIDAENDLIEIEAAWLDETKLEMVTPEDLDGDYNDDWATHAGTPLSLVQFVPGVIALYPKPQSNSTIGLKLKVSLRPSDSSTGISDNIYAKYRSIIESGTLARLMLMPNKPWTNTELAAYHLREYEKQVDTATFEAARGFNQGRIKSRPKWA